MGNYVSRRAAYSTKEVTNCETPDLQCEARRHRIVNFDPRSPTAEIVRTPIQVDAAFGTPKASCERPVPLDTPTSILSTIAMRSSEIDLPSLCDLSTYKEQRTVDFEDMLDNIEAELTEIEETYNPPTEVNIIKKVMESQVMKTEPKKIPCQKLRFSPEKDNNPKTNATKARTPLGTRSSNTTDNVDSPSTLLRMKQQRWLQEGAHQNFQTIQQNGLNCENTPPSIMTKAATLPRRRQIVEWDKDSTIII